MNEDAFQFCPRCGRQTVRYTDRRKWFCAECNFTLYNNVAAAVGLVIADKYGGVLFETRAKNPRKGMLALPGGFVDADESAEEAAIRECFEETGFRPSAVEYLCSFPNDYDYKDIAYKTCDIFFTAQLPPQFETVERLITALNAESKEVLGFSAVRINAPEDIAAAPLAFESARKTLTVWLSHRKINP